MYWKKYAYGCATIASGYTAFLTWWIWNVLLLALINLSEFDGWGMARYTPLSTQTAWLLFLFGVFTFMATVSIFFVVKYMNWCWGEWNNEILNEKLNETGIFQMRWK